ncbi:hypothetical protein MKK63_21035, partial [Methylobacterium sp. J-088]|uniref:hypothetical protein n=1 Tax=Methylobacterium sp. J-088 TaxID=2836664 RepID=UPI001FBA7BE4
MSPALQQYLQQQAQQQAQAPTMASQDVPATTPPGFTGYQPQTPPTGAPTPVVQPGAQGLASAAMGALGPSSAQAATMDPGDIRGRFIGTLQQGGLTNPNGLGAVAAYAQHESRYSPGNIIGSWSDPSESGQAGQSGGILSWRADRLANMKAFTQGAADPVTAQANFLLQENPQLTQALQNAQSPSEAHRLMADAWKFAGYDRPGGENAARLATTQAYANSFGGGGQALPAMASGSSSQMSPGISRPAGASMGSTAQQGGFGLGGIVGQGAAVPGQASPTPDVAILSGQPLSVTGAPDPQPSNQYAQISNALKSIAGAQQKQAQGGGGAMRAPEVGGRPISLQQARAMFDPGRFYGMLRGAG